MKKRISESGMFPCFLAAVLFSFFGFSMQAEAKFRSVGTAAAEEADTAQTVLASEANAVCPSLDTHYGKWSAGQEFHAEFVFESRSDIAVIPAAQLDIRGGDGTSYNNCFRGTCTVQAGNSAETDIEWMDEQSFGLTVPADTQGQEIKVTYTLFVKTAVPEDVLYPEFSCALIQSENQTDGFRASCRKVTEGKQTGFSTALDSSRVLDGNGHLFGNVYGKNAKKLNVTVTPDDADTVTAVRIYRLGNTADPAGYRTNPAAVQLELGEKAEITAGETYTVPFAGSEGRNNVIIVDAENAHAGHRVYSYHVIWPAGGPPVLEKKELDLNGSVLD